ncbi:MAG: hypothetical protein ACFFAE_17965 [Candidatus Hodarchaeota archaeon]
MAREEYLFKISFAGKLNGDLVDIHADTRFDKQYYYSGIPLINTKQIQVDDQSIKLVLAAFPPNLQQGQLNNFRSSSAIIFCFDKSDSESFLFAQQLFSLYREKYPNRSIPNALISVITNDKETISTEEGKQAAAKLNMMYYEMNLSDKQKMHRIFVDLVQSFFGEKGKI